MTDEQRDETHVEQHGDGDVNIEPSEGDQPTESPAPSEGGESSDGEE